MGLTETLIFYLLVGATVAIAMYLVDARRGILEMSMTALGALLFWPLYLPLLLSARRAPGVATDDGAKAPSDEMAAAIAQVELELDAALSSLDGWAESALASERGRIAELRGALGAQAARVREMDALLAGVAAQGAVKVVGTRPPSGEGSESSDALDRWRKSERARSQNLTRLAEVRRQAHGDLMATLAWIRELVSMIHLAKYTGAPASRAEELVAQIAAAVEGVSAVAWSDPEPAETTRDVHQHV